MTRAMLQRLLARLRRTDGYTMPVVVAIMLTGTTIALGAFSAAAGDIRISEDDVEQKRALAAAEAGLSDYLQRLGSDNEVWLKCTNLPPGGDGKPAPVNQIWDGAGTDPRVWKTMPSEPRAAYTIELLPRPGYAQCQPNADASMMDASGTIRIRVTGRSGVKGKEVKRSLVATLRRNGFLDFLYFTDYETSDPVQLILSSQGRPVKRCAPTESCPQDSLAAWASDPNTCERYVRDGRGSATYPGSEFRSGAWRWPASPYRCPTIYFIGGDEVRGPFHTNDTMAICGSPKFGRNRAGATSAPIDRVEFYDFRQDCSGAPDFGNNPVSKLGDLQLLQLPQSNTQLRQTVQPAYLFSGQTTIVLNGNSMTVNGVSRPLPSNGLIYIANGGACPAWDPLFPYAAGQNLCGDVILRGTYSQSLTIAAERDILVNGNVTGTNNALLGLIANNYVRVFHPVRSSTTADCPVGTTNDTGSVSNLRIEAAILSLGHVFTVDNYQCGAPLGNLTIVGAIAQKFRGPVGRHNNGTPISGYVKDYVYDDRLKLRSPPHFLAPVQSAWRVVRATEQVPPL